ncbi:MAG TPA: hypothetical protein VKT80_17935, partial [Chloroflexota bacterium]|nr:hypothetical protein [Chloroflexota bacterium]
AAVGATGFNPSFAYMSAGVHNDNLTTLLGAAVIWWSCRLALRALPTWRSSALGGLLLGLALLTKTSALALVPVVVLALVVAAARGKPLRRWADLPRICLTLDWRKLVSATAVCLGVAFAVAGWWYVRNIVVYGDPVAWQRYLVTHAFLVRPGPYNFTAFRDFADQLAHTYWAAFGYMNLIVDPPIYLALWFMTAIAVLGLARVAWLVARDRGLRAEIRQTQSGWLIAVFAVVVYAGSLLRYSMTLGGVGHGRLIFPILPIASLLLVIGLTQVGPRAMGRIVVASTVAALAILAAACPLVYIRPAYAIPAPVAAESLLQSPSKPLTFGESFRLVDVRLDPGRVTAGGNATVHLYWQSKVTGGPDLLVITRLRDRDGTVLYQKESRPLDGHLPTDRWVAGAVYDDALRLDVPVQAYSGSSPIEVSVRPFGGGLLEAVDESGAAVGGVATVARLGVVGQSATPNLTAVATTPSQLVGARLGDSIELRGFDLTEATIRPSETVHLVLYWQALGPITTNYTVFTHVADAAGRPVAQTDSEPLALAYPTTLWQPSEQITDPYSIVIPANTPPGRYRLLVGMYDHVSGARLPITTSGVSAPQDAIDLTTVIVGD